MTLSIGIQHNNIDCHYAECRDYLNVILSRYAECSYAECRDYLNVILSVVMLNVVMLSVVRHVIMLSVVMLNVVMLSVVAPSTVAILALAMGLKERHPIPTRVSTAATVTTDIYAADVVASTLQERLCNKVCQCKLPLERCLRFGENCSKLGFCVHSNPLA